MDRKYYSNKINGKKGAGLNGIWEIKSTGLGKMKGEGSKIGNKVYLWLGKC